ncbi:hypothetical protein Q9L58_007659 [Maublancomyces gigas]|uniref:Uncharacterized protein n=1 Tax=Discina gigas TaxID=1032678 RepID=A0ABR3GD10_9PEZI
MKSFTLLTFPFVLAALLATPSYGEYVERRGYDQKFGSLEARDPLPKKRGGGGGSDDPTATDTGASPTATGNFAPANMANMAGVGIMVIVAGAAAMH